MLHSYLNQSQIDRVAWMGLNFYDYHDFQKIQGGYRIMKHTVAFVNNDASQGANETLIY